MVTRCECCGQPIRPTLPMCTDCGHPLNSHHATPTGKGAYCTVWVHNDGDQRKPMIQCRCEAKVKA